jgi:mRNA interferase MazF
MTCSSGDIVAIPFPYSDLTTRKKRPVLVITKPDRYGDFVGLAITSVLSVENSLAINGELLLTGNLPKESRVRYDKIFTLSESMLVKTYGTLKPAVFQTILDTLCGYLGCTQ